MRNEKDLGQDDQDHREADQRKAIGFGLNMREFQYLGQEDHKCDEDAYDFGYEVGGGLAGEGNILASRDSQRETPELFELVGEGDLERVPLISYSSEETSSPRMKEGMTIARAR